MNGVHWAEVAIAIGAFAGLTTTILTLLAAIPRVFMSMGMDGLLPQWFGAINQRYFSVNFSSFYLNTIFGRFKTPVNATITSGVLAAAMALAFPISALAEMVCT